MVISPTLFRRAFNRFQAIHTRECGSPLDSFADRKSYAFETEGYKNAIPDRAMAIMEPKRWKVSMIGSGEILKRTTKAIEIPGNNLLQWEARKGPNSRVHSRLLEVPANPKVLHKTESLLFDLYKRGRADEQVLEGIIAQAGRRYELLGYLFFVAAPDRFLPIRTKSFDRALAELGVSLRTQGNCNWENYGLFLSAIREVQRRLQAEGITDATFLDAHSFCWILARHKTSDTRVRQPESVEMLIFTGVLQAVQAVLPFTPNDAAEVRDMKRDAERRQASGQIAEEVACNAERNRLRNSGHTDLAAKVEPVGDRPGLGYDIKSFEEDGSDRFIEVKNVSNGNRFFLSEGEWLNSRVRSNYWFYLVSRADTLKPVVTCLEAGLLDRTHLQPIQHIVRFA